MTNEDKVLVKELRSPKQLGQVNPRAIYRTKPVATMEAAANRIEALSERAQAAERQRDEALAKLAMIGRMKLFPDDKINRTTLQSAIHIALSTPPQETGT